MTTMQVMRIEEIDHKGECPDVQTNSFNETENNVSW